MKIRTIVEKASEVLGIAPDFNATTGATATLVKCANAVIEELTLSVVSLRDVAKATASGGRITYESLGRNVREITDVIDAHGDRAEYVRYPDYIFVARDGLYAVKLCYYLCNLGVMEEFSLPPEYSEGVLVYGVLSEYYYRTGLIDEAIFYRNRFDRMATGVSNVRSAPRTVRARRLL